MCPQKEHKYDHLIANFLLSSRIEHLYSQDNHNVPGWRKLLFSSLNIYINLSPNDDCPVPGACNQDVAIYEATVTTDDGRAESYVGLAKNFKRRFPKHKSTLGDRNADRQTKMSKYVWRKRVEGLNPKVAWTFLEKNVPDFNPVTEICILCTREKFQIFWTQL